MSRTWNGGCEPLSGSGPCVLRGVNLDAPVSPFGRFSLVKVVSLKCEHNAHNTDGVFFLPPRRECGLDAEFPPICSGISAGNARFMGGSHPMGGSPAPVQRTPPRGNQSLKGMGKRRFCSAQIGRNQHKRLDHYYPIGLRGWLFRVPIGVWGGPST